MQTETAVHTDAEVRNDPNLIGRAAYEASLKARPTYADGTPRPSWEQLSEVVQWSWTRPLDEAPRLDMVALSKSVLGIA